ncbi:MAG TPA: FAD-dependent oxidoreductase [Streptosporangiaceae bacterium]|jgi:sarcosine oxidase|nr:FAD-dependent oxidoreductase [Streptosporangiaceae bacterium]
MAQHEVAVVGAGLLGLATARALAARGRDVVTVEQATVGHPGGGSHGSCRIFRLGYPDPGYVTMAARSRQLWQDLEAESGRVILHPVPQLTFGPGLAAVHHGMRAAGAPAELLTAREAAERFPGVAAGGQALLEPESCVIAADQALAALAAAGPSVRTGFRVTEVRDDGREVTLRSADGEVLTAGSVVLCAGPWTAGLAARAGLRVPSAPTLEQVAYVAPADGAPPPMPIFIHQPEPAPYGLPVPGSGLYKIGIHPSGPPADLDRLTQDEDAALAARFREVAARFVPSHHAVAVRSERCVYDSTPDDDFVLDRSGRVVAGCGTSGHGFKFGPLLGGWLAGLALGEDPDPAPARFALSRFSRPAGASTGPP